MLLLIAEHVYFVLTYIERLDLFENSPSIPQRQQSGWQNQTTKHLFVHV